MATKWEKYSKEELEQMVKDSTSYAGLAKKLGYALGGSYIMSVNTMIQHYDFNVSHFTGQGWNKGNFDMSRFTTNSKARTSNLRNALINFKENKCECCGNTEWLGKPIKLEIHHIDGDNTNHDLNNLQLLCPNCHSFTDNYRKKKPLLELESKPIVENPKYVCSICGKTIEKNKSGMCRECLNVEERTVERPLVLELAKMISEKGFEAVGRDYGVSGNAIKKWCDFYKIPRLKDKLKEWYQKQIGSN